MWLYCSADGRFVWLVIKVVIVCTTSVRTDFVMMPVRMASMLRSERAFSEGILKEVCHWSSPVMADTGIGAYDAQTFGLDS